MNIYSLLLQQLHFLSMLVNKYHERDRDNVTDATFEEYSNILRLITPA